MEKPNEKGQCWLDPVSATPRVGSIYPAPFGAPLAGREKRALGYALKLTQFGVDLVTLAPGSWSSQRHWHAKEDEFIYVLQGEGDARRQRRAEDPYGGDGCGLSRRQGRRASSHQSKR
ncbi:MAG TPA: cupin domain-containing protein [Methyloceanibacter sp.]|nr:cupin domain-containing protein [Methyloceanibacter sp.]